MMTNKETYDDKSNPLPKSSIKDSESVNNKKKKKKKKQKTSFAQLKTETESEASSKINLSILDSVIPQLL
jgi:hypothetical protein